jgi:hypothetical protein
LAKINVPMVNESATAQSKRRRTKAQQPLIWKFEIIHENSDLTVSPWPNLRRNLRSLVEAGRNVVGDIYVSIARVVLERKEEFEDRRAERKARQRIAAPSPTSANSAEIHLVKVGSGIKNGLASNSKSHV